MKAIAKLAGITLALAVLPIPLHAAGESKPAGQSVDEQSGTKPEATPAVQRQLGSEREKWDVEELNDVLPKMRGRTVTVVGEVEDRLSDRAFVLESGGLFDDEIVVIVPPNTPGLEGVRIEDDQELTVVGTVRAARSIEIEREYGWDLDQELEVELEGTRYYLIAQRITRQQD